MVRLNETFHLQREAHGFALVEKTVVTERNTGKKKIGEKKRFTGTLYQALQLFLICTVDRSEEDLSAIREAVEVAIHEIEAAGKRIKQEYCLDAYKSRGKNRDGR